MVIIRMTGGLGNQMFQYALYLKLKSMGKEVKFDDFTEYALPNARPIQLWAFGLSYPVATREEVNKITDGSTSLPHRIRRKIFGRKSCEYMENSCNFDERVLQADPAYLTGYFQSEKYFADIKEEVRKAFVFQPAIFKKLDKELRTKMDAYTEAMKESCAVSLHIRRGDYLENQDVYGNICTPSYYDAAINKMKKEIITPVFYVFSNDEEWADGWCREQEEAHACKFVPVKGFSEEMGYFDMYLMSLCSHQIVANSSFSWWGAWLNNKMGKIVIAPAKWYNHRKCVDIYTSDMIRITSEGEVI